MKAQNKLGFVLLVHTLREGERCRLSALFHLPKGHRCESVMMVLAGLSYCERGMGDTAPVQGRAKI